MDMSKVQWRLVKKELVQHHHDTHANRLALCIKQHCGHNKDCTGRKKDRKKAVSADNTSMSPSPIFGFLRQGLTVLQVGI